MVDALNMDYGRCRELYILSHISGLQSFKVPITYALTHSPTMSHVSIGAPFLTDLEFFKPISLPRVPELDPVRLRS
jgi:hypothetical protein